MEPMSTTLDINVYVHFPQDAAGSSLPLILAGIARLETKMAALDDQITALTAQVKANTDVENSALVLINGFSAQLATAVAAAAAAVTVRFVAAGLVKSPVSDAVVWSAW